MKKILFLSMLFCNVAFPINLKQIKILTYNEENIDPRLQPLVQNFFSEVQTSKSLMRYIRNKDYIDRYVEQTILLLEFILIDKDLKAAKSFKFSPGIFRDEFAIQEKWGKLIFEDKEKFFKANPYFIFLNKIPKEE